MNHKLTSSLLLLMLTAALRAMALPAIPEPIEVSLPDGSVMTVRLHGNERFHWYTDSDTGQLLEYDTDGWLVPVIRDGRTLSPCDEDLNLLRDEQMSDAAMDAPLRVAQLDDNGRTNFPTTLRSMRVLIVPVQFADKKFSMEDPVSFYNRMFNERGYSDYGSYGCAAEYFEISSGGKFSPIFEIAPVVTMSGKRSQYASTYSWQMAIPEMVRQIDRSVNFSRYDCDNDGMVDNVHFIYAGEGQADSAVFGTLWPHSGKIIDGDLRADNKKISVYSCSNELRGGRLPGNVTNITGIGIFCHSFCNVMGLPDLYDDVKTSSDENNTPGRWSVMDVGCYEGNGHNPPLLSGFEQWMLNWREITDIEESGHYTLKSLFEDGGQLLRIKCPILNGYHENEYFLAECRPAAGWDYKMPESGIIFWHIDFNSSYWRNNTVNRYGHYRLTTVLSDASAGATAWPAAGVPYQWVYPGETPQFMPHTAPSSLFTHTLTDIRYNRWTGIGEFDFNTPFTPPPPAETVVTKGEKISYLSNDIRILWAPVATVSGRRPVYMVTISRDNEEGNTEYLEGVHNRLCGKNSLELYLVNGEQWNQEWNVSVRVADLIPTETHCQDMTFIPAECEYASAVAEMDSDTTGSEGGTIYTLDGRKAANGPLAPGIYIIREGAKAKKIMITQQNMLYNIK